MFKNVYWIIECFHISKFLQTISFQFPRTYKLHIFEKIDHVKLDQHLLI